MSVSSVDFHQRRGAGWDVVDEAISLYDEWMLDDDYNELHKLREIIKRMKERRAAYGRKD